MNITLFKKNEIVALQQAIHEVWGKCHVLSRDVALLEYMFAQTPKHDWIATSDEYSFLGVRDADKVVGLLGVMPFLYNQYGKKGIACCLTNWVVEEAYRHTGAGLKLIQYVLDLQPDMVLSLGVGQKATPIYKLMRWEMNLDVPRWVGVVHREMVKDVFLNGNSHSIRYYDSVRPVKQCPIKAKLINSLDVEKWDDFYWTVFAKKTIGIARDAGFINWRYLKHPNFDYKLIAVENEHSYKGLAVIRIEKVAGKYKIGRIVEMMYDSQESAIALANAVIELDNEVLFFDFYCFSSVSTWGLETVGFKRVFKSEEDPFVLPTRFQPIDLETTNMVSAIYLSEHNKQQINCVLDQQWYITKGDSDQDRPN